MQTQELLDNLGSEWVAFQQCIIDAEVMLRKNKEKFKTGLLSQSEEFRKRVGALCSDFLQQGPFTSQLTPESALEIITQFKLVIALCFESSDLYCTRGITPKRVTSGGVHLFGVAPKQHSSEETSKRWRAVGDTVPDLTYPGIEPLISRTNSKFFYQLRKTRGLLLKC